MRRVLPCLLVLVVAAGCRSEAPRAPGAGLPPVDVEPRVAPRCVHHESLRPFLPEAPEGMRRTGEEASTGRYGSVSMSEVERTFSGPQGRELRVRIVDTTLVERLGRAIVATAEQGRLRPESDPTAPIFWKDGGVVGLVRYEEGEQRAEASLLVGGRYVVAVSSRGYPGTVEVRRVAQGMDLEGLARLR